MTQLEVRNVKLVHFIPGDEVERLIYLGQGMTDIQWEVGRRTIVYLELLDDPNITRQGVSIQDIYHGVGELVGKSANTIRSWVLVARFYSQEDQDEYGILPFSHFRLAMKYPDNWREILGMSVERIEANGGRPPSVDWLEIQIIKIIPGAKGREKFDPDGKHISRLAPEALGMPPEKAQFMPMNGVIVQEDNNSGQRAIMTPRAITRAYKNLLSFMYKLLVEATFTADQIHLLNSALDNLRDTVTEVEKELTKKENPL